VVTISPAQLGYLLEGIDWRAPQKNLETAFRRLTQFLWRRPRSSYVAAAMTRAAAIYTLIETCRMNGVDPRAWLADVLRRLPGHPASRIADLLPWNWKKPTAFANAA
jgi:hypothetical protein